MRGNILTSIDYLCDSSTATSSMSFDVLPHVGVLDGVLPVIDVACETSLAHAGSLSLEMNPKQAVMDMDNSYYFENRNDTDYAHRTANSFIRAPFHLSNQSDTDHAIYG